MDSIPEFAELDPTTQAIIETLQRRAVELGNTFEPKGSRVTIRCLDPGKHTNGDSHPSATYTFGKYLVCPVCGLKKGQKALADMLGIGLLDGGLTLAALATAKKVPVEFLRSWSWETRRNRGQAVVAIPWYDDRGPVKLAPAYHLRRFLSKDDGIGARFIWDLPKHAKLLPYGSWRIPDWRVEAEVLKIPLQCWLMESEMDAVTGWLHGVPSIAYGGTNFWKPEWAEALTACETVYVVAERDKAGQDAARRISLALHDRLAEHRVDVQVVMFNDLLKDFNAIHQTVDGDTPRFQQHLRELIRQAIPASKMADEDALEKAQRERAARDGGIVLARPLLEDPAVLHKAILTVENLGVVGERQSIGIIQLALKSRALKRPVNLEVNSPSSSGKTFVVLGSLQLDPESAYYELTAGSERSLIYLDEPLEHRILYIQEPEGLMGGVGLAAVKSLIWEGRLKYDTVVKEEGEFVGRHIEKDGPTGLILTSTRPVDDQISNRMLRLEVDSSIEQTRRILAAIAASMNGASPSVDLGPWHALSAVVGGTPMDVEVPYGAWLSERISTSALRIRRDFTHLMTLIQSSAVFHQFQRVRGPDERIRASLADYAHVHTLSASLFNAVQDEGITDADRDMVAAVAKLTAPPTVLQDDGFDESGSANPTTQAALKAFCKLGKSQVAHRVSRLLKMSYLVNTETRKGRPHQLLPGVPLPEPAPPLPSPCDLATHLIDAGRYDLIGPWIDPVTGEFHNCFSHLPPTPDRTDRTPGHLDTNHPYAGDSDNYRTPTGHPTDEFDEDACPGGVRRESGVDSQIQTEANRPGVRSVRSENGQNNENETFSTLFPTDACTCDPIPGPANTSVPACETCGKPWRCPECGGCRGCRVSPRPEPPDGPAEQMGMDGMPRLSQTE